MFPSKLAQGMWYRRMLYHQPLVQPYSQRFARLGIPRVSEMVIDARAC